MDLFQHFTGQAPEVSRERQKALWLVDDIDRAFSSAPFNRLDDGGPTATGHFDAESGTVSVHWSTCYPDDGLRAKADCLCASLGYYPTESIRCATGLIVTYSKP